MQYLQTTSFCEVVYTGKFVTTGLPGAQVQEPQQEGQVRTAVRSHSIGGSDEALYSSDLVEADHSQHFCTLTIASGRW